MIRLIAPLLIAISGGACAQEQTSPQGTTWELTRPEAEGIDPGGLSAAVSFVEQDPHGDFRSLVIARNGHLVAEHYFNGNGPDSLVDIRSATKSITSTLVGMAIAQGLIPSVETPVMPLFPRYMPIAHDGPQKRAITIEHLLTMSSGLDANADDPESTGYEDRMWESDDWVRFVLDLPMVHEPGEDWSYSSASSFLAGAAVEEAAAQNLAGYASDVLFAPLGFGDYQWLETPKGRTVAQGNLSIRARDMAKIGQLYLDDGRWKNQQLVPQSWIRASVEGRFEVPWNGYDSYGYGWYTHSFDVNERAFHGFGASGNGGNKIYVFPKQQLVVVIQSTAYNTNYGQRRSFEVLEMVLAAVEK